MDLQSPSQFFGYNLGDDDRIPRWQQVVDYFHASSGIDEPNVQSETDRYMAWPAQALGYKIGQLKIIELREKARKELGPRFDIRGFHDEVLSGGAHRP